MMFAYGASGRYVLNVHNIIDYGGVCAGEIVVFVGSVCIVPPIHVQSK